MKKRLIIFGIKIDLVKSEIDLLVELRELTGVELNRAAVAVVKGGAIRVNVVAVEEI